MYVGIITTVDVGISKCKIFCSAIKTFSAKHFFSIAFTCTLVISVLFPRVFF